MTRTGRSFTSCAINSAVASPVVFGLVATTSSLVSSFAHALYELGYAEVFWLDAVEGREGAAEDMVEAAVLVGALHRADVVGVFHDADHGLVAAGVAADLALLGLGEVEAAPAHGLILSFTSCSASASPKASSFLPRITWKAMRWALLGPMEGSFESSVMSRSTGRA